MFKLTTIPSWEGKNIGSAGTLKSSTDTEKVLKLSADNAYTDNITFYSALAEPVTATVNLANMTMTFPASVGVVASGSPVGPTVPTVPDDVMFVISSSENMYPWTGASNAVRSQYPYLTKQDDGTYSGTLTLYGNVRILAQTAPKGEAPTWLAPKAEGTRSLHFNDGIAYSTTISSSDETTGWWHLGGSDYTITVDPSKDYLVKVVDDNSTWGGGVYGNEIYLIGLPQGWNVSDGSMPLKLTENGGYYGSFNVEAGESLFRFYTELGDWGSDGRLPSIGATPYDMENEGFILDDTGSLTTPYSLGKGNWSIDNWPGGMMYVYLNPADRKVRFSTNPIAEAGDFVTALEPKPVKEGLFYSVEPHIWEKANKNPDGTFCFSHRYAYGNVPLYLRTRDLPLAEDEPYKAGSFTLIPSLATADFPYGAVQTVPVVDFSDYSTQADNALEIATDMFDLLYDPKDNMLTLWDVASGIYFPDFKDYRRLSLATAEQFEGRRVPRTIGGIIELPAGTFNIAIFDPIYGTQNPNFEIPDDAEPTVLDFSKGMQCNDDLADDPNSTTWSKRPLKGTNFPGGKLFINNTLAMPLNAITEVKALCLTKDGWVEQAVLSPVQPESLVFKGTVKIPAPDGMAPSLNFQLASGTRKAAYYGTNGRELRDEQTFLTLGSPSYTRLLHYSSRNINEGQEKLVFADGKASSSVQFNSNSFALPTLTGEATVEVTLDLNEMKVDMTLLDGETGNMYETVSDPTSALNGATAYPNQGVEKSATMCVSDLPGKEEGHTFNLVRPDGATLVPETGADAHIEFGDNGVWNGKFTTRLASAAKPRATSLRMASGDAKWHFSLPEGTNTNLTVQIDEKTGTLILHSSAHMDGFFITEGDNRPFFDTANIPELCQNMLRPTGQGVYTGFVTLTDDKTQTTVCLASDLLGHGLNSTSWTGNVADLTSEDFVTYAWAESAGVKMYAEGFKLKGNPGKVYIKYDSDTHRLTFSSESGAVEAIGTDAEADKLTVTTEEGGLRVWAPAATVLEIHNLSGALVRKVNVSAGVTHIELPAGFYIAAGSKLLVK